MTPAGPLFHKPKSFFTARQVIYAGILIGVLSVTIRALSDGFASVGGTTGIAITIVFYAVIIFLVKQMSHVHKWARTAVLILYVLAMLAYPVVIGEQIRTSIMVAVLLFIQAALIIYALVLLYNKECTKWFNSGPEGDELP